MTIGTDVNFRVLGTSTGGEPIVVSGAVGAAIYRVKSTSVHNIRVELHNRRGAMSSPLVQKDMFVDLVVGEGDSIVVQPEGADAVGTYQLMWAGR